MNSAPSVSIVIPNWNGKEFLQGCLKSLGEQTLQPVETILVDNGSSDDSVEYVRRQFSHVRILTFGRNRGFAVAVNAGIREARGEYIALINTDTELQPDWLELMVEALLEDSRAGSASCKMLRHHDRTVIDAAGDLLTRGGAPYSRGAGEIDRGQYDQPGHIFGACSGAALYRRSLFQRIGEFDEDFISYYEDADLAYRAQLAGYACQYVPAAVCYHHRGGTAKRIARAYPIRMQERNLTAFYLKNFPWQVLLRRLPLMVGSRARRFLRATRLGFGVPSFRGLLEGILLIPLMLRKRPSIQRLRRVPIPRLIALMDADV